MAARLQFSIVNIIDPGVSPKQIQHFCSIQVLFSSLHVHIAAEGTADLSLVFTGGYILQGIPMIHISQSRNPERLTQPATECDQVQGLLSAVIVLVEYGDYQCPHCKEAHAVIKQVQQHLGSKLCFVFRHFPLTQIHPQARQAAEAVEAASDQDMFWQMHEMLFACQQTLGDGYLVQYANDLGLNMSRFLWDFSQHVYSDRVQSNFLSGVKSGVTGTPTFFINNVRLEDGWKLETLMAAIKKSTAS